MSTVENTSFLAIKDWLAGKGGGFHCNAIFAEDISGSRLIASDLIHADAVIVSCPFNIAITQEVAKNSLVSLLDLSTSDSFVEWTERQCISTYICLHWILGEGSARNHLNHSLYLNTLPSSQKLRTPLHFNPHEREAMKGTNLYGAAADRERDWRAEWTHCRSFIHTFREDWAVGFTWEIYLTAATYLSSRAFPSSLLSPTPSLIQSPTTGPVLLPGIDSLNHSRGQAVSWTVNYPGSNTSDVAQTPTVSLVLHAPTSAGQELFNNYGPKPNSELILGYGFSLPHNPDDTIILKIGGINGKKWEIGREARGAAGLWDEIVHSITENPETEPSYEDYLDASSILSEMIQALLERLPPRLKDDEAHIRPEVALMMEHYLEGQRDILTSLMAFSEEKEEFAIEMARTQGIHLILE